MPQENVGVWIDGGQVNENFLKTGKWRAESQMTP